MFGFGKVCSYDFCYRKTIIYWQICLIIIGLKGLKHAFSLFALQIDGSRSLYHIGLKSRFSPCWFHHASMRIGLNHAKLISSFELIYSWFGDWWFKKFHQGWTILDSCQGLFCLLCCTSRRFQRHEPSRTHQQFSYDPFWLWRCMRWGVPLLTHGSTMHFIKCLNSNNLTWVNFFQGMISRYHLQTNNHSILYSQHYYPKYYFCQPFNCWALWLL